MGVESITVIVGAEVQYGWMGEPLVDAREHSGHSWRRQVGQWKNETTGDGQGRLLSTTPGRDAYSQPKRQKGVCVRVCVCV